MAALLAQSRMMRGAILKCPVYEDMTKLGRTTSCVLLPTVTLLQFSGKGENCEQTRTYLPLKFTVAMFSSHWQL
jgi:hypothetical protein